MSEAEECDVAVVKLDVICRCYASVQADAGSEAFEEERELLLNPETGVSAELRRIAAQETIDSVSVDSDEEAGFFAQLLECDESLEREGRASLDAWVTKRLQFDYQLLEPEIGRYIHNGDRTLVPVFEAFRTFEESIDRDSSLRRRRHEMPLVSAPLISMIGWLVKTARVELLFRRIPRNQAPRAGAHDE